MASDFEVFCFLVSPSCLGLGVFVKSLFPPFFFFFFKKILIYYKQTFLSGITPDVSYLG